MGTVKCCFTSNKTIILLCGTCWGTEQKWKECIEMNSINIVFITKFYFLFKKSWCKCFVFFNSFSLTERCGVVDSRWGLWHAVCFLLTSSSFPLWWTAVVEEESGGKAEGSAAGRSRGQKKQNHTELLAPCSNVVCWSGVLKLFLTEKYNSEVHLILKKKKIKKETKPFLKLHVPCR